MRALNAGVIESIPDAELEEAIIDFVIQKIEKAEGGRTKGYETFKIMPMGLQAIFILWEAETEVRDGGFNQLFWNKGEHLARMALACLKMIGALEHAKVFNAAIAMQRSEASEMKRFRDKGTIEAFSESIQHSKLGEVNQAFFELKEDLGALRVNFIRKNPDLFTCTL